jgi:hypothetical protein
VARHRQDLLVVGAALDDHVDLDRAEAGALGGVDAAQHVGDREVGVVHAPEDPVVDRVEADRDAAEPGRLQGRRLAREDRAVGRQREVETLAVGARELGQHRDQPLEVAAQERLAAGEADLLDAVGDEQARDANDLLEGEQRRVRQEAVVAIEDFLRHAVAAAEVAAVGDRDAQVAQRPMQAVEELAAGRDEPRRNARRARGVAVVGDGDHFRAHAPIVPLGPVAARAKTRRAAGEISRRRRRRTGAARPAPARPRRWFRHAVRR